MNFIRRAMSEAGMTTAEYAIGTVAACGFGGVLVELLGSDVVRKPITVLLEGALKL